MNIAYLANVRMPTEKAHGLQIAKTIEALTNLGVFVRLIVPKRENLIIETPEMYYGLRTSFPITYVPVFDTVRFGQLGFLVESISFALRAVREIRKGYEYIYGRDEIPMLVVSYFTKTPLVWESHTGSWNLAARVLVRKAEKLVVISEGLKDFYVSKGVPKEKIVVAPDGIDLADFRYVPTKEEARAALSLPQDKPIALYVGKLDSGKGVDTLGEAAAHLPKVLVVAIGGSENELAAWRATYPHVTFLGPKPYRQLPQHLQAADVLVLPNTGKTEVSSRFTSPLKLFAYLAAGKPIVASDVPSIREVLDEDTAYLVTADNPHALAAGITRALQDTVRAPHARTRATAYTWQTRAHVVLDALSEIRVG